MKESKRTIYLDYAATAAQRFSNPGGIHGLAEKAHGLLEDARKEVARVFHVRADEIVFTASATEANNMVVRGLPKKGHIITTAFEHPSVLEPIRLLEREGASVTYLLPNEEGVVSVQSVKEALRDDTVLVSIMYVQNEIGSIQPISSIGRCIRAFRGDGAYPLFHVDAAQAPNICTLDVGALRADLVTVSSHKLYGPMGAAALMKRSHVELNPLMVGGGQEYGLRPGTENVPAIVGFADVLKEASEKREEEMSRLADLRSYFIQQASKSISDVHINGPRDSVCAPSMVNLSFIGVLAEQLVVELDVAGIAVSAASACSARGDGVLSYVVSSLGVSDERLQSAVRFSFGRSTSQEDLDVVVLELTRIVSKLRAQKNIVGSIGLLGIMGV